MLNLSKTELLKIFFITLILSFIILMVVNSFNKISYFLGFKENPKDKIIKLQNDKIDEVVKTNKENDLKHKYLIDEMNKDYKDTLIYTKFKFNSILDLKDKEIKIEKRTKNIKEIKNKNNIKQEPNISILKPKNIISLEKPLPVKEIKKIMKEKKTFYTEKDKIKKEIEYNNSLKNINYIWDFYKRIENVE